MERRYMLAEVYKRAETLAVKLVSRLLEAHIVETTSDRELREAFVDVLRRLSDMEEFDIQYKTAPIRGLVANPNFISLYLTQYIIEDLLNHRHIQDVFGDDLQIYQVVDSVISSVRPE
ncbi:MAG: hypothetical protein AB1634_09240 [Thermodesulfobacteriota bacterium]